MEAPQTITIQGFESPLTMESFTSICTKLSVELYESADPIPKVEQLANVVQWFTSTLPTVSTDATTNMNDHQLHFITIVLPKCIEALMKREYTNTEHHPLVVNAFFKHVLALIANNACLFPNNISIAKPLLGSLLSPTKFDFYAKYGVVRPSNGTGNTTDVITGGGRNNNSDLSPTEYSVEEATKANGNNRENSKEDTAEASSPV